MSVFHLEGDIALRANLVEVLEHAEFTSSSGIVDDCLPMHVSRCKVHAESRDESFESFDFSICTNVVDEFGALRLVNHILIDRKVSLLREQCHWQEGPFYYRLPDIYLYVLDRLGEIQPSC